MKKIFFSLLLTLASLSGFSQLMLTGVGKVPTAAVTPTVSVIQAWYDSLSVKPSAGLWADLKTLADGLKADGDWDEADFISLTAGIETQEQALRPLKTNGAATMSFDGTDITWSTNGFVDLTQNFSSGINSGWNPNTNKVKYQLTSAFAGVYGTMNNTQAAAYLGLIDNSKRLLFQIESLNATTIAFTSASAINYDVGLDITKNNFASGEKQFFASMRKPTGNYVFKFNSNSSTAAFSSTNGIPNGPLYIYGYYDNQSGLLSSGCDFVLRFFIVGSSLIDHDRVASRLNAFFAARGLSISNY